MRKFPTVLSSALRLGTPRWGVPLCAVAMVACGAQETQDQSPLSQEPAFAAIPRADVASATVAQAQQALVTAAAPPGILNAGVGQNFYLAIKKKELDQRYFLSMFAKQYFPTAVSGGASRSMGTRVIAFHLTNDRLYVYEVNDIKRSSISFAPDAVLLDSFPVVTYAPFDRMPGATNYILIDPAAGLNKIGLSQGGPYGAAPFQIELSFLQNFRALPDGVAYEQVVTGYSAAVLGDDPNNLYRGVGTVGVAWRRYQEGKGFQTVVPLDPPRKIPVADAQMGDPNAPLRQETGWGSYFFVTGPRLRAADSTLAPRYPYDDLSFPKVDQPAIRWNLEDPAKKIDWIISPLIPKKYQQTVLDAITSWNKTLGRTVVTARVANPGETLDDDDKNFILYDGDPTFGAAFANWRNNPLTGEILGASVYINAIWFQGADDIEKNPFPNLKPRPPEGNPVHKSPPRLQWQGVTTEPLCELWADDVMRTMGSDPSTASLTPLQQAQNYVFNTVSHEVGHTLGLRHNFKGSLGLSMTAPAGNSVMEYQTARQGIASPGPQSYDQVALDLLYKLNFGEITNADGTKRTGYKTPIALQIPFCTDDGVTADPDCQQFDEGVAPLTDWHSPNFDNVVNPYLLGTAGSGLPNNTLNNVAMFLRAGTAAEQLTAWNKLIAAIKVGAAPPAMAPADYNARVSTLAIRIWQRLFLDPAAARGNITGAVPMTSAWQARYIPELSATLLNTDGRRSYPLRRLAVDVLAVFKSAASYNALVSARAALAAQVVPPASADLQADLITRVDVAIATILN